VVVLGTQWEGSLDETHRGRLSQERAEIVGCPSQPRLQGDAGRQAQREQLAVEAERRFDQRQVLHVQHHQVQTTQRLLGDRAGDPLGAAAACVGVGEEPEGGRIDREMRGETGRAQQAAGLDGGGDRALDELRVADVLTQEEELGVDPLTVAQPPRCRHGSLGSGRHPAGELLVEAHLLDAFVDPVHVPVGKLTVEARQELVLHRLQVASQEADQGRDVPPAAHVVVHAAAEAGVVVEDPSHLLLQLLAVVVEPAHQRRVDPVQALGLGIERRPLGAQMGQHHILEVVGHPGECRQLACRVAPLVEHLLEL
jgi:hypothetical protein